MSVKNINLADPQLELTDPTPDVHALFKRFDKLFFWSKLEGRAAVRWSRRMFSSSGLCSYGKKGFCDIALSEPLLKLRPRKDFVQTLLHEMIHAYLFVTNQDQDRDGHGRNFLAHMDRINKAAGLNIGVYHYYHNEVCLYQTHWWRCNGPCRKEAPAFGIVKRANNKPPGPHYNWWGEHQRRCAGTFVKIKEPEKKNGKSATNNTNSNADITKYISTETINTPPVLTNSTIRIINPDSNNPSPSVFTGKGERKELVECPVCASQIDNKEINRHLDQCLNKDLIEKLLPTRNNNTFAFVNKRTGAYVEITPINTDHGPSKGPSKGKKSSSKVCPCCGATIYKTLEDHLDNCLAFFNNFSTIPDERYAYTTSFSNNRTTVIEDDESQVYTSTGNKAPCPCCMRMIELRFMNYHVEICLQP